MTTPKHICLYEDDAVADLDPLVHLHPAFELVCGTMSPQQRVGRLFPDAKIHYRCRDHLTAWYREQRPGARINDVIPEPCLFINGRALLDPSSAAAMMEDDSATYVSGGVTVGFWNALSTRKREIPARLVQVPWDLVRYHGEQIEQDMPRSAAERAGTVVAGAHLVQESAIHIGANSVVRPGVVLDASEGPIIIDRDVTILPNAVIIGPCFVGHHSLIKAGAAIYGPTYVGPWCKVGGEVEGSILQGYSNKQHDGFLGHSYVGLWCNLGAGTTTSDLKNNYGPVRIPLKGRDVDSGLMFVGVTMGDHSKSGINTMFNSGTVVGVACNVFGAGFPPKDIPSFTWMDIPSREAYDLEKALAVARTVMARRQVVCTSAYEAALRAVFALTQEDRDRWRSR